MTKMLFLVRHGETDWNVQNRFQGHIDIPLNDKGRHQAEQLISVFRRNAIEAFLCSDLSRAIETAQISARRLGVSVFQDPGLREAYLGKAQGLTHLEIEEQFGSDLVERWRSSKITDADISYPGGETGNEIYERSVQTIHEFAKGNPFQKIGVVTHGGVIRRIMQRILPPGAPPVPIPNGVVYQISYRSSLTQGHGKSRISDKPSSCSSDIPLLDQTFAEKNFSLEFVRICHPMGVDLFGRPSERKSIKVPRS